MRIVSFFIAACSALLANATIYYVSPSGSDSNNGTSTSTPWKTLDKVTATQYTILAGDQILFQRGGVYRGTLSIAGYGTAASPIVVGAYGTGALPIISGGTLVSTWSQYGGNIYKATIGAGQDVKYLFSNGQRMTLARYPNTGWLRNDHGTATSLQDADLTQSSGYWTGATLVVRASNWNYDLATVSGFSGSTLTFPTIYDQLWDYDWGYFLCNKLSELDQAGEWFYDKTSGVLYFWAPSGGVPTNVEVANTARGAWVNWHRPYINIHDLAFQYQTDAGVFVDDADHISVTNCTFTDVYRGIVSVGSSNTYSACTFTRNYASGIHALDNSSIISDNTLTDIAMVPGLGETSWGYFGIRSTGTGVTIRNNRLRNIGYIGIVAEYNALVEKNVVDNAVAILNDGGGIAFDYADGLMVQDNIVRNCVGDLESSAPDFSSYLKICHGIYFGNHGIRNTTLQRNTVYGNKGSGIHVDHSMNAANNVVKDNVLFNNDIQLSLSDYSNYSGPSAVAPYYVANFNETYSGNTMYCMSPDQLCMKQYNCYSALPVDFGTFSNNKYFNPYNEMSIYVMNTFSGAQKYYALERWKADRNEDAGSTRSPLRQNLVGTASELSGNLVVNGNFDSNVTGWTGWPTNAQVSRVTNYLDNGALKAYLPNNSVYPNFTLRNPDYYPVVSGQWYRMKFSIQSSAYGDLSAGLKGQSQVSNPYSIWQRQIPFDTERRDLEFYFQSTMTDQAVVQFVNQYTEPLYYLDNVQVHKVTVSAIDPNTLHKLYVNDLATTQTFTLPAGCWSDVGGTITSGSITVQPYASVVMYKMPDNTCSAQQTTAGYVSVKMMLGGAYDAATGLMRDDLRVGNYLPGSEPYSAMGITVENPGATMTASLAQVTGAQAVVDWVLLELRNNDAGYSVLGRRSALLRRDGTVITPDGNTVIPFNVTAQGHYVVVRHRNHCGAMLSTPVSANGQSIDFTASASAIYGTNAEQLVNGVKMLYPGNVTGDGSIKYTGSGNDRDPVLVAIGSLTPTNRVTGYRNEDVNLDGSVLYTGAGNDRDVILVTVGDVPTVPRVQQVP